MVIKWSEIEKEAGNLKDKLVELYLKYEGKETDEVVRGKPVKVTVASFARHMGIKEQTFRDWHRSFVARNSCPEQPTPAPTPAPHCVNNGVPPRKGFVLEAVDRLTEGMTVLDQLSDETHQIILEDIQTLERLIEEIKSKLKVGK